jgi:hypothetical protein
MALPNWYCLYEVPKMNSQTEYLKQIKPLSKIGSWHLGAPKMIKIAQDDPNTIPRCPSFKMGPKLAQHGAKNGRSV